VLPVGVGGGKLRWLRKTVEKMLPKIDLPDLVFEVHAWTGFLDAFVHLGDGKTRMRDLATSVVALLVSEACNIGLTPVINPNYDALTRTQLVATASPHPSQARACDPRVTRQQPIPMMMTSK
jgi:hypothetical protein